MVYLTEDELILVLVQALVKARKLRSGLPGRQEEHPKIHVALQGVRRAKEPVVVHSDEGASSEAKETSKLRASLAEKHSTDSKAMTSYSVGHVMNSGYPSSKVLEFAGGVPLYKEGKLVGSVGISGDAPEVDEAIAHAASANFEAPEYIKSDVVFDVPFHSGSDVREKPVEVVETFRETSESPRSGSLPPLASSVSIATLPALPKTSSPPTPTSLPPLSRTGAKSSLPSLPPSPSLSTLPPSPSLSSLPPLSSTPRTTSLPVVRPTPKLSPRALPPMRTSGVTKAPTMSSPRTLPPIKGSSLSPMGTSGMSRAPVLPSPVASKGSSLPPISSLMPLK